MEKEHNECQESSQDVNSSPADQQRSLRDIEELPDEGWRFLSSSETDHVSMEMPTVEATGYLNAEQKSHEQAEPFPFFGGHEVRECQSDSEENRPLVSLKQPLAVAQGNERSSLSQGVSPNSEHQEHDTEFGESDVRRLVGLPSKSPPIADDADPLVVFMFLVFLVFEEISIQHDRIHLVDSRHRAWRVRHVILTARAIFGRYGLDGADTEGASEDAQQNDTNDEIESANPLHDGGFFSSPKYIRVHLSNRRPIVECDISPRIHPNDQAPISESPAIFAGVTSKTSCDRRPHGTHCSQRARGFGDD